MMLGTDVSSLSTTATNAAAQGLSIVVPLYNEATGLASLHERLVGLARTLRQRYGLACEVIYVDDGSNDNTLAIARELAADALDVQLLWLADTAQRWTIAAADRAEPFEDAGRLQRPILIDRHRGR